MGRPPVRAGKKRLARNLGCGEPDRNPLPAWDLREGARDLCEGFVVGLGSDFFAQGAFFGLLFFVGR